MNTAENRRIVEAGLEHRRVLREEAAQEARLEQHELDMIRACNIHCAGAREKRETMERSAQRRAEIAQAKARAWELECKATNAVRFYGVLCLITLLVSAVTKLPFWAAATLIISGCAPLAAYIYRLYVPFER